MPIQSLKVTALPPDGFSAKVRGDARPLFRGSGETDYACGHCGAVMAADMGPGQRVIVDTATCAACGR